MERCVKIVLDCDERFLCDDDVVSSSLGEPLAKYNFLKLPHDEHGFNYLDCDLRENDIFYDGGFVISYGDVEKYLVEMNCVDDGEVYDFGTFFVSEDDDRKVVVFGGVEITNAWVSFYIYKK